MQEKWSKKKRTNKRNFKRQRLAGSEGDALDGNLVPLGCIEDEQAIGFRGLRVGASCIDRTC